MLPVSGAASFFRYNAILDDTLTNKSPCTGMLTHAARQRSRLAPPRRAYIEAAWSFGLLAIPDADGIGSLNRVPGGPRLFYLRFEI